MVFIHEIFEPLVKKLRFLKKEHYSSAKLDNLIEILIETFDKDINPTFKKVPDLKIFPENSIEKGSKYYSTYWNAITGEKLSIGDYVESVTGMRGIITHFGIINNEIFVYTTWGTTGFHLSVWKKIPGKQIWLHKPSDIKFVIEKDKYDSSYCYDAYNCTKNVIVKIPAFIILNKSQDWIKL